MLTDATIRAAKPTEKPYKLSDGEGLYLLIKANGARLWRFKYRYAGKEKRLSLGTYPDTGLADARRKHGEARKLLAAGIDPGERRKAEKLATQERNANTFGAIAAYGSDEVHDIARGHVRQGYARGYKATDIRSPLV